MAVLASACPFDQPALTLPFGRIKTQSGEAERRPIVSIRWQFTKSSRTAPFLLLTLKRRRHIQ
ncbi:hypothetical protein OESDEN_22776 [Oesophagostomum dentatum]|uniref:Uncharacterized protein n=1 Tax=Oesophagostomum dentatum TaxID=61180 RepID=A0A0B1RY52_OESDE|nr:hypothetical protein OESDEN_22776 [Oesophagostomum dentatum]